MTQLPAFSFPELRACLQAADLLVEALHVPAEFTGTIDLQVDSRRISRGSWFLAYRGEKVDSHQFLNSQVLSQLGGVIYEDEASTAILQAHSLPALRVKDSRKAWAYIAAARYGHPENDLRIIGVTGTNGKTSTVWVIKEMLAELRIPCLSIGTLGAMFPEEVIDIGHTTPDPEQLFRLLAEARRRGVFYVVMEVSSHAIAQKRLGPIQFSAAAFTSFSRDHLDFHHSMEEYFAEKWRFITEFLRPQARVLIARHVLDALQNYGQGQNCPSSALIYRSASQQVNVESKQASFRFLQRNLYDAQIEIDDGESRRQGSVCFVTEHGAENFLAGLLLVESLSEKKLLPESWMNVRAVPGRLEAVRTQQTDEPIVFVDYAHTPDAIERTLQTLRGLTDKQVWIVFGCGGDRDPGKRPLMAKAAAAIADRIVITSDNPRSEDPQHIIEDILQGLDGSAVDYTDVNRRQAIYWVVQQAEPGDVILIAGKGHETYQLIGNRTEDFDDRLVAKEALLLRQQGLGRS
ncbi:MAG: UDP-N-acetylmuramoyl-L-alanyl-D-glutamate--2,6-diaminopimelate ligase [Oligoflexus sp.]